MGIPYEAVTKTTDEAVKNNLIKNADILISAMGSPHAVNSDMVKEGCDHHRCRYFRNGRIHSRGC
jgi:glutamyl-tRNA reductase